MNSVKLQDYKVNIQKSILFLHTNNELHEKEIKKNIPFAVRSKNKIQ